LNIRAEKEPKSEATRVRLAPSEKQKFKDYCSVNDVKEGRLLRKVVRELINKEPDLMTQEMEEFKAAVRQLAGISRNLNQITRKVNSGATPSQLSNQNYWDELGEHVKEVRQSLDSIIDKTENRWVSN